VREPSEDRALRGLWGLLEYLASRLRRRAAKAATLWAAAAVLAALAAVVALDAAVGLPPCAFLLAGAAGIAAVALASALAYRPRPSTVYLARLVERRRPELKEALVTLVDLAADPSSDLSMQRALARRAGRILARDPPHAFLPTVSWRRPGWALAAGMVILAAVLGLERGTAFAPRLAGAGTGTGQTGGGSRRSSQSAGTYPTPDEETRPLPPSPFGLRRAGPRPARAQGEGGSGVGGAEGAEALTRAGGARVRRGAGAAREEGSEALTRAEGARVRRGAGAAREEGSEALTRAGGAQSADTSANGADGAGSTWQAPPKFTRRGGRDGEHAPVRLEERSTDALATSRVPGDARVRRGAGAAGDVSSAGSAAGRRDGPREPPSGPPLPQRNPSEAVPENVLDAMRRRRSLIEGNDRPTDGADPDRTFLGEMGVSPADERRYTTAWSEGRQQPRTGPDAAASPAPVRTVPGQVEGRVREACGGRPVVVPPDAGAGERGRLIHAAEGRVSPRLRPAVRAYFERIGRLGAGE